MFINTPINHARDLLARGLAPIPIPHRSKGPNIREWQHLRLTADDLPQHFNGAPGNIGTLLGEPAGWIVDVDLDHPTAVELADDHLPPTGMVWGRESKPRSHRLYRLTEPAVTRKWSSKQHGSIVELRSTGCQTIAPGSTHPSGEPVRWDDAGEPTTIDPAELIAAIEALDGAVRAELGEGPCDTPKPAAGRREAIRGGTSNYGSEALRRECSAVAFASEGERNDTLNTAAFNVGTLIGGGEVDRAEAESELLSAALSCGLPDTEARRTIASGINAGTQDPRQRPTRGGIAHRAGVGGVRDTPPSAPPPVFSPISARELISNYPNYRPVVIADLLRKGETMNVIAAPKIGKSWLVHALALAVASGRPWLGKQTARGRVLLIDGELHEETLAGRLQATQTAMGVSDSQMDDLKLCFLRGERVTIDDVAAALCDRPQDEYCLIVFDALYRFLPIDGEENSNETMTHIYNRLDAIAKNTGASVVVIHHTSKGDQSDKSITDVGAGAGAQSRATDSHLILRPHETDGAVVVDAVVRSFPPMGSFVIQSTNPGWRLAPDLDPTKYKKTEKAKKSKDEGKPPPRVWTPESFAEEIVGHTRSIREDVIARGVEAGLSKTDAASLLKRAREAKLVHKHQDGPSEPQRFSVDPPEPAPTEPSPPEPSPPDSSA